MIEPFPQLESDERPPSRPTIDEYPQLLEPMDDPEDEDQREFELQWDEWRASNSFTLAGPLKMNVAYIASDRYVQYMFPSASLDFYPVLYHIMS